VLDFEEPRFKHNGEDLYICEGSGAKGED
jgi:hypothetical protein